MHDNIARSEGLASLPSAHRKGDESRYNLWYTNQRGIQKALDLKRGCMAKSLLHKELQMFPDVPVRKKTRIQNILKDIGINSLEELGYEEREKYLREIEKLKGNLLQKSYLEELDAMKLASIKWAAERRAASDWNVRYSEQKFFLPYFPVYKIAKTFDPEEDREILLWDFSVKGYKTLKRQVFKVLLFILKTVKDQQQRRGKYLLPLKDLYSFSVEEGIEDLRKVSMSDETDFRTYLALNAADRYDTSPPIIDLCRKTLFVQNYVPCWESYVWYLERLHLPETMGDRKLRSRKLSFLELDEQEDREILQQYTKRLLQISECSLSTIITKFLNIREFLMFIEKEGYIAKGVNAFVTERYFLHLEERENSTSSFNMKVNAVRDLQEYLLVSELIEEPFMRSDYYLKKQGPLKPKQDISEDDLQVLVNNLKHFPENIRLMSTILLFTGIQKSSLFQLRTQDIYWEEDSAWMRVKNIRRKGYRIIPISSRLYVMIGEFILREKRNVGEYIFKNKLGDEYTGQTFEKRIVGICKRLGILEGKYIFKGSDYQKFTVRFMYQQGVSVSAIREYLGYRDDGRIKELTGAAEEELAQKSTEYFSDPKNSLTSGLVMKGKKVK